MSRLGTTIGGFFAAGAAALALFASAPASATTSFTLVDATMDQNYIAYLPSFGWAISNGVTFDVAGYPGGQTQLFGFCIDIYHDMYVNTPLNYTYTTNEPTGGGLVPNSGTVLTNAGGANPLDPLNQISDITNLVDTGFILHQQENAQNHDDTEARLAAIQAAIWQVAVPGSVTQLAGGDTALFQHYFNEYTGSAYTTLADANDRVFTITEGGLHPGVHQTFAVGWPISGTPEPASWGLMIMGFGGIGAVMRRYRAAMAEV